MGVRIQRIFLWVSYFACDAAQKIESHALNLLLSFVHNTLIVHTALETVSPTCTGDSCYDMILADYYHTAERSVIATFTPSVLSTYLSSFKAPGGMYNSFAEANAAGGSTCLWVGTATYDAVGPDAASIVDCSDMTDCLTKLEAGDCDLFVEDIRNTKLATQGTSIVCTEEIIGDTFFFANPMASNLEPNMMVLLSKWYLDAGAGGKFDELEATYFGGDGDDGNEGGGEEGEGDGGDEGDGEGEAEAGESITLSAGFMEATNFAERGEDGTTWSGFLFDLADVLVDKAAADGVMLEIAIDTVNGVLSDSFSYNEALETLDPDCAGELCYDLILADCKYCKVMTVIVFTGFVSANRYMSP